MKRLWKHFAVSGLLIIAAVALYLFYLYHALPDPTNLRLSNPQTSKFIENKCRIKSCKLKWVKLDQMSSFMIEAVVLAEDLRFFLHKGIDGRNIITAMRENIKHGKIVWGGSSITMQLAKNLYLTPDKTILRKLKELILTWKLERALTKERILEIYLNIAEWGPNLFGIGKAAEYYFNKSPAELGPYDAAFLASILPNPELIQKGNIPTRFMMAGEMLFRKLLNLYLPQKNIDKVDDGMCEKKLSTEETSKVDYIIAKIFNELATEMQTGKAQLISIKELLAILTDEEDAFVDNLLNRIRQINPGQELVCERGFASEMLTPIQVTDKIGRIKNFWLTKSSVTDLSRMIRAASQHGINLKINSAYRADGYQLFNLLKVLRKFNYCLSEAARLVALPTQSEHGCTDRQAIDFIDDLGEVQKQHPAYQWLLQNAKKYNFTLSYSDAENEKSGFYLEPWHWLHRPKK